MSDESMDRAEILLRLGDAATQLACWNTHRSMLSVRFLTIVRVPESARPLHPAAWKDTWQKASKMSRV